MASDAPMLGRIGRPAACCLACLAALPALACLAYYFGPLERFDLSMLSRTQGNRESSLAPLAEFCAHFADPVPVLALSVLACLFGLVCGRPRQGVAATVVVAGASLTTLLLKSLLAHPRFDLALGLHQITATAFPSGHSTAAMAVALAFALAAPPLWRPIAVLLGGLFAVTNGIFLVFLGDHFPSDVAGGWLIAMAWLFAAVTALGARAPLPPGSPIEAGDRKLSHRRTLI
jgi:membrane-associated phospholipid phosphatase